MNKVYFWGKDRKYRSLLADRLDIKPGNTVLVSCCGTGLDFNYLLDKLGKRGILVGVDISPEMLRQAKKKTNKRTELVRSDIAHMPFRNETFDDVYVAFCLKITPTFRKSIQEMARLLKNKSIVGVLANHKPSRRLGSLSSIFTMIIGAISKIDFEIDLREHFSQLFVIIEDVEMHGGLVRFLIARTKVGAI